MKAKLIFNLPEDTYDYDCAIRGHEWRAVVTDLEEFLRQTCKHGDPKELDAEMLRVKLFDLLSEYSLTI